MAAVLGLLGFQPRTIHGAQQRGACPLHGSTSGTSRCFSVNLDAGMFHCFKCGRSGNNALDLWAHAQRLTPYDAALDLCRRLAIPVPLLAPPQNREEEPVATESMTCTMEST
jgi:DNA primase